ncbi:AAA-domain-containing protein [Trichodelitschia bisporula]|uniref:Peroxisomal ATPase PEX6 n=1 Tax=Trichodelitschia bisporula TaxID=703511 RepID=A0A6G1HWW3_9PEZI|nr:AAA-domain-containing protein [Trichodelitschia bisporula]
MDPFSASLARRKRRRRRRQDRPPISAHLLLDDRLKDDVGILSEDLLLDLFPGLKRGEHGSPTEDSSKIHFIAISTWQPASLAAPHSTQWTILPVRAPARSESATRPHSSVHFPASSGALQSFLHALQSAAPGKAFPRRDTPIEIRVLDVVPLGLETVFVTLDSEALRKLADVQARFGGGFGAGEGYGNNGLVVPKARAKVEDTKALESVWRQAVRDALRAPKLVHAGDLLPLPLPAHPITHAPPPPAKITACEPISQGLLLPSTRVVIVHSHKHRKPSKGSSIAAIGSGIPEEDEDTSNETFYSAAEERSVSQAPSPSADDDGSTSDNLDTDTSMTDQDDLSDDSEDTISLMAPTLLPHSTGILSTTGAATPRFGAFHTNGIATPGSTYSSFTTSTVRGGPGKSKLFKAQGLLQRLPDDLLHPKPVPEDDEEARVFVDTSALVKIGCFSGDWVRLEAAAEPVSHALAPWKLGSFDDEEEMPEWRAAKIYGLPESVSKRASARLPSHKMVSRKTSFLDMMAPHSYAPAFVSPLLLANLGAPTHLRVAPLYTAAPQNPTRPATSHRGKVLSSAFPPYAKEVTLLKLSTPLSTDRLLQPSLFAGLKDYFEQKRRIVKSGDLVGIAIDESLGRSVFQPGEEGAAEEILFRSKNTLASDEPALPSAVAWFKVGPVTAPSVGDDEDPDLWGGVVSIDPANTKMVQAGSEQGPVPPTTHSTWPYYLGLKHLPAPTGPSTRALGAAEPPEPHISATRRRLRELVSAATSPAAMHMGLPPLAVLLTSTQRLIGKAYTAESACADLGLHVFSLDAYDILSEGGAGGGDVKTEAFLKARAERALTCGAQYTALLIRHVDALTADRMISALKDVLGSVRVIIATTTEVDKVPDGIRALFTHELEMSAPDEKEREGILLGIVQDSGIRLAPEVDLSTVAMKTAALVAGDLSDVIARALVAKRTRLEGLAAAAAGRVGPEGAEITVRDVELAGGAGALGLTKADFESAVETARKNFADAIGAPKIPNVGWDDVGGLTHVKDAVMETIQLPLARPELFAKGMKKRSGILFYGPPGTGKTLLAKAIATEFSLNFFSVKGPELLNMYIGESEANVRRVFQKARDARPCVVFFDELDSVAPKRGNQGDSGGVMDRIVSQLLAELDGMSDGGEGVFVIGATNRPDLLDQALLRPGRFDKMLYLGISDTHDKQQTILEALTRKFSLDPDLSLKRVASTLPFTFTGADLYALCSDAMLKAITRQAQLVDAKVAAHNAQLSASEPPITVAYFFDHLASEEDTAVQVTEADFESAKRELVPSVSVEELQHYEGVRRAFEGAGTKEGGTKEAEGKGKAYLIRGDGRVNGHASGVEVNGNGNGVVYSGKGKGKSTLGVGDVFGDPTDEDEEMYA